MLFLLGILVVLGDEGHFNEVYLYEDLMKRNKIVKL
jgi:hypothetical protein